MASVPRTWWVGALCFVVGTVAGIAANQAWFSSPTSTMTAEVPLRNAADDARIKLRSLNELRAGETQKAIDFLEMALDADTLQLGVAIGAIDPKPAFRLSTNLDAYIHESLQQIYDYRRQYPRPKPTDETAAGTDRAVAMTLSMVKTREGH
jgi:hypothetical protein